MVDKPKNPAPESAETAAAVEAAPPPAPTLRSTWQLPALIAAGLMLVGGIAAAVVTAPKPNYEKMLQQAEGLVEHEDYRGALEVLNKRVRAAYDRAGLTPEQGRRFHLLRARAVYLGEKQANVENEENARSITEEYAEACKGGKLETRDLYFLAEANITLGRYDKALEIAGQLPATERNARGHILKRIVERELGGAKADASDTLRLLADFLKDPELPAAEKAWALSRQAEILLREGLTERAIARLVQTMPALVSECTPEQMGELYLLLGRAYWDAQAVGDAGKQLERAVSLLPETDEKRGEAMVLLAKVDEQTRQPPDEARQEAKQKYAGVVEQFPGSKVSLPALLGLGEVEAAMNEFEASLRAYTTLVHDMAAGTLHPDVTAAGVAASLIERFRGRYDSGDYATALRYATLAEGLFTPDAVPPEVLLAIGNAQRKAAEELLRGVGGESRVSDLARVDPATREQARLGLLTAGRYFKRHAERLGLADNVAFGESLWKAADSFDLGGDPEQAIPLFSDFAKYFPADPRQAEARFRLGQAYQAKGEYGTAAQYYRALRDDATREGNNAGPFGDLSAVPLAQCLLMDTETGNDDEAQSLLEQVVRGRNGGPTSRQFRDGLVELARLEHRRRDFAGAISHLEEAVTRFPDDPRIDDLRYDLADAYRQDAHSIEKTLDEGMPEHRKQALREARTERLRKARDIFDLVRRSLEAKDARRLDRLAQVQLRNSYFYLGDCDFDLKDYESAIRHYDAARERYPKDPASLVAMMQIVNAYLELGDVQRAQTANNRAKQFYDSLPPTVWNDPDLPMGPDDWKRWLESMSKLRPMSQGEEARPPSEAH